MAGTSDNGAGKYAALEMAALVRTAVFHGVDLAVDAGKKNRFASYVDAAHFSFVKICVFYCAEKLRFAHGIVPRQ